MAGYALQQIFFTVVAVMGAAGGWGWVRVVGERAVGLAVSASWVVLSGCRSAKWPAKPSLTPIRIRLRSFRTSSSLLLNHDYTDVQSVYDV